MKKIIVEGNLPAGKMTATELRDISNCDSVVEMLTGMINERSEKKLNRWKKIGIDRTGFILNCLFNQK